MFVLQILYIFDPGTIENSFISNHLAKQQSGQSTQSFPQKQIQTNSVKCSFNPRPTLPYRSPPAPDPFHPLSCTAISTGNGNGNGNYGNPGWAASPRPNTQHIRTRSELNAIRKYNNLVRAPNSNPHRAITIQLAKCARASKIDLNYTIRLLAFGDLVCISLSCLPDGAYVALFPRIAMILRNVFTCG